MTFRLLAVSSVKKKNVCGQKSLTTASFFQGYITISGGGDSYYEYLLKTHILMDGKEEKQLEMWKKAVASMKTYLRSETADHMVFLAELDEDYKLLQTGELVNGFGAGSSRIVDLTDKLFLVCRFVLCLPICY